MKRHEAEAILGVSPNASEDEIKKSFRKLAAETHPDRNKDDPSAEDKFKTINQAYQILTGKEKAEGDFNPFGGAESHGSPFNPFDIFNMDDIINNFYNRSSSVSKQQFRVDDIEIPQHISFEEAILGATKKISYKVKEYCQTCEAQGIDPNKRTRCQRCNGTGVVKTSVGGAGFIRINQFPCPDCQGGLTGEKCQACNGNCFRVHDVSVNVKIPPVGDKSARLLVKGKGNFYKKTFGDVYVRIIPIVKGSGEFNDYHIYNNHVMSNLKVTLDKLLFGGKEIIKTVGGEDKEITIEPFTKTNDDIYIKGYGVRGQNPGDHIITIEAQYPNKENLTEELKQALENAYKTDKQKT